jgi:predicted Zn-dependent peptidase
MEIVAAELDRLRSEGVTAEELKRARENVKARIVLGLESAGARMSRLGASVLYGLPLLEIDEIMARIDAVSLEDLRALVEELWVPQALSAAGIGPDEAAFTEAVAPVCPAAEPLPA